MPTSLEEEIGRLPEECRLLLNNRDGGWELCVVLPKLYSAEQVSLGGSRD
jgi:hypothetical protein